MTDEFVLPGEETEDNLSLAEETLVFDLLEIGTQTFTKNIFGHDITIKSLNVGEEIKVLASTKEHQGTEAMLKSYKAAIFAACVQEIDGRPFYTPLVKGEDEFPARLKKAKDYHSSVIDEVFIFYNDSLGEIKDLIEKLGKSNG